MGDVRLNPTPAVALRYFRSARSGLCGFALTIVALAHDSLHVLILCTKRQESSALPFV
jgi:hypothetical protein